MLASLHESILVTLPTVFLTLPLALIVYAYVNTYWGPDGLFHYTRVVSTRLGSIQLYSWLLSYFLYIVYTVDYVDYMVLKLPNSVANALTIILPILFSTLVVIELSYLTLFILSVAQIILALPIPQLGWIESIATVGPAPHYLFTNILSSSLLIVCITLIPYANGYTSLSKYVLYAFVSSSVLMIIGGFFKASFILSQLTSLGYVGLIIAEYTALYNLLHHGLGIRRIRLMIPALVILLDAVSLINYNEFYNITIVPSVAALYLTLLISFSVSWIYLSRSGFFNKRRGVMKFTYLMLSIVSSLIMVYGIYTVLAQSSGVALYEVIAALVIPIALGLMLPLRAHN
ncbi:hypothetical protein [Caldivirga sp.]|uniref:hypothetical protein n=1 Tax=Caldivirga sp. TaxID=2080243 RepID=UPI0025B95C09|nr:hypothetical protein [Caldivirga sp.]